MCEDRHKLYQVTLEYAPRPADRETRVRTQRADISTRAERKGEED